MPEPTDGLESSPAVDYRSRRHARLLLVAVAVLLAAAVAALAVDIPLSKWCLRTFPPAQGARPARSQSQGERQASPPAQETRPASGSPWWLGALAKVLRFAEVFGHGIGVAWIVLLIFQLDPLRRWVIPRLLAVTIGAGLSVDLLKILVGRTRPHAFHFAGSVWSTFTQWLPLGSLGSTGQSLPSGHTGTAVGLAIVLVWAYPRGRWLFPVLAVLVACQRVQTGAHWLSDVLSGAVVGCLVALVCLDIGPIPRAFSRWESAWRARDEARERETPRDERG